MSYRTIFRKTKIIATIGPASDSPETLKEMIRSGMNVARLNLSHGTYDEHRERLQRIRKASRDIKSRVAIMIDTRGIEIRTGKLTNSSVELRKGADFTLRTDDEPGDESSVSVSYKRLPVEVKPGEIILLDDGAIELEVRECTEDQVFCTVTHGGGLGDNKGVNVPDSLLSMSAVGPENRADVVREMEFAVENDVDYIAASFIQTADDIHLMRQILNDRGVDTPIIAKIENKIGVENLQDIVASADGLMVARGDLGVELPFGEVPMMQKKMIRTTVKAGKPAITATQMLASMEHSPRPTRAEASDVSNAILDGSSAIMLSDETAAGDYPVEAVRTMNRLALTTEACLSKYGDLQTIPFHSSNVVTECISQAVADMAHKLKAIAIVSLTDSGFTSRLISKQRPECLILAMTSSRLVARRLCMNWGVLPELIDNDTSDIENIRYGADLLLERNFGKKGDTIIVTFGHMQRTGSTDMIRVITL